MPRPASKSVPLDDVVEWEDLPALLRVSITRRAMADATATLAQHAEIVAREMKVGRLADRGGPAALRLYAELIRGFVLVVEDGMARA